MSKVEKTLQAVLSGTSDRNIRFTDLLTLLQNLNFSGRTKGSHHIFWREGISDIINLQPLPNNMAKPYQVKQVRNIILKHKMGDELL